MPNLLFIYLRTFSTTGGIEKVNRVLLKALYQMHLEGLFDVKASSPYAVASDEQYFPNKLLEGYRGNRWRFMLDMLLKPMHCDLLFVAHINLAPAALLLKWRHPQLRIIVIAHGIEVWSPLSMIKRKLLHLADRIITVSQYTKDKMITVQGVRPDKIEVLPNCLDPFFQLPEQFNKPAYLLERYGLKKDQKVLLTITRLNAKEGYKGYDLVLKSLPEICAVYPDMMYILGGKYDETEKKRLDTIIRNLGIEKHVIITGFVADEDMPDHYLLADAFVMPSKKEGFGLVFIEAMACGTAAVGGNLDGSIEALRPGELGYAVNPDEPKALVKTVLEVLNNPLQSLPLQQKLMQYFNYPDYLQKLKQILINQSKTIHTRL